MIVNCPMISNQENNQGSQPDQDTIQELSNQKRLQIKLNDFWGSVLMYIRQSKCEHLSFEQISLTNPLSNNLLTLIAHIRFDRLKILDLSYLEITSIEPIASLDMKSLRTLNLTGNFITSVQTFNKTNWPDLEKIDLKKNQLRLAQISRAGIKYLKDLRFNLSKEHQLQIYNPKVYLKLQSKQCEIQSSSKSDSDDVFSRTSKIDRILKKKCKLDFYFKNQLKFGFFDEIQPNIQTQTLDIMKNDRWERFQLNSNWTRVLEQLIEAKCSRFQPDGFDQKDSNESKTAFPIIKSISHIQFTYLKRLDLSRLKINSIQGIAHMRLDKLSILNLTDNLITSVKILNKIQWLKINQIDLKRNKLQSADMSRSGMKKLDDLRFNLTQQHQLEIYHPKVFVKLESRECEISSNAKSRIDEQFGNSKKISLVLKQKAKSVDEIEED